MSLPAVRPGQDIAQLLDVVVRRGDRTILDGVSITIRSGRVMALLGHSGAGKSTLLQVLTGELAPLSGVVDTGGHELKEGVVYQEPLLLPWLTVAENAALGQTYRANRGTDPSLVTDMLELLGIAQIADRYPDEISGGQAQRVALARALAVAPDLLLLDEPFSALDPVTRSELQEWLRAQVTDRCWTTVMVTHDLDEALVLADDILLLAADGRIRQAWTNEPSGSADPERFTGRQRGLRVEILAAYRGVKGLAHV